MENEKIDLSQKQPVDARQYQIDSRANNELYGKYGNRVEK